jgi:uncharacterized SAM-binding protein YcdF (DUF218 family)
MRINNHWRSRILITLGIVTASYFLVPFLLTAVARSLIRVDVPAPADIIISLSGDAYGLREHTAATLYQQGMGSFVVVSGYAYGSNLDTSTASEDYLLSLGIPASAVLAIPGGNNTRLEADHITALMRARGWHTAIIVTSSFHSRRALYTFERTARDLTFYSVPVPAQAPEWQPDGWWKRRGDFGCTLRESLAWGNTLINGWK